MSNWLGGRRCAANVCANEGLGLIFATSIFALPLALAAFPQQQAVSAKTLEAEFHEQGGKDGLVEFNRGI